MGGMILLVLATGLWSGPEPEKETKLELDKLQGTWILESVESKGAELPKDKIAKNMIVIRGDKLITSSGEKVLAEVTFTIDATKSPKWIDQTFNNKEDKLVVRPGIYELTGDTLRLAFDRERPKELKSTPESSPNITVYKRKKE
jgi:uncharacterized protein (TIGR03067 family)